jgi:Pyruvate/2-oxoglutarate dehydrogenase complex, dehydrogenase (E1) component, eukaryotic type, beta subunit
MAKITYREAVRRAMIEEMERDPNVFLMGEEVGHYHGAYKVSQGMLEKFGEERVVDTPISEQGFAGLGIGAAMLGLRLLLNL